METCSHTVTGDYISRKGERAYVARTYLQIDNETFAINRWKEVKSKTHSRPGTSWSQSGSCIAEVNFGRFSVGEVKFTGGTFTYNGVAYLKTADMFTAFFSLCTIL